MEKEPHSSYISDSERPSDSALTIAVDDKELEAGAATTAPAATSGSAIHTTEQPPSKEDEIPDGGLQAWLQVLGSSVVLIDTWGLINSYGVFQAFYEEKLLTGNTASEISWIGSIQGALLFLVGVFAGPLYDAGHFRHLLLAGLFLIIFGMFMTSLCTVYWQFLLAQGICVGTGMGMTFLPSAAILSQYFKKRRSLVLGISSAGSPIAGIVFPIIFSKLEPAVGFGWATRIIAFILLALSVIPIVFMRTRIPPPSGSRRAIVDKSAFRDSPYVLFVVASFFSFLTLYVPFFYVTLFVTSHGAASADFAPYLVTLLNVGSVFGRLVPNALADRWGSLNVLGVCMIGSTAVAFGWLGVHNLAGSVVFALLYGALSGGVVSLTPSVLVSLSPDLGRVGVRLGMSFLTSGIALLIGTPIAGAIVGDYSDAEWLGTITYTAVGLLVATVLYAMSRLLLFRRKGAWKA